MSIKEVFDKVGLPKSNNAQQRLVALKLCCEQLGLSTELTYPDRRLLFIGEAIRQLQKRITDHSAKETELVKTDFIIEKSDVSNVGTIRTTNRLNRSEVLKKHFIKIKDFTNGK